MDVIDPLADSCEAGRWLADPAPVRRRNRAVQESAGEAYRSLYA